MAWRWVIGPPGAGKTERAVAEARHAAAAGRRVAWIGLPAQRDQVLRRLVADGPLLGAEFLTFQQLALLQLGRAGRLRPQLLATARLALVAEALAERVGALPTPGEAGLFTRAIAEAKRHGRGPASAAALARDQGGAGEVARLAEVHAAYERLKGDAWDDDDVRAAAQLEAQGVEAQTLRGWLPAEVLIVDGWREVPAADLVWLRAIAGAVEVVVTSVADPPAGCVDDAAIERLRDRPGSVAAWRFANPVAEVRWVLRALARDLADGHDPRDLAVVAPRGSARALLALAGEFGVVLADEAPRALVDLPFGRVLADLLELPDHPTAGRLLAVPALVELGRRALADGLAGRDAIGRLAEATGAAGVWEDWLTALTPAADALGWAREVVALAADLVLEAGGPPATDAVVARAQEAALRRAQEAARLAGGEGFRAWWLALLRASSLRERPRPGVALIEPRRAAGRRFRRAYLVGAVAGAYDVGEREDYFVPEEARVPAEALHEAARGALPQRYRGLDADWRRELRVRADHVVVTHAEADRGGPLRADEALLGAPRGDAPPELPTASALEVHAALAFEPASATEPAGPTTVETLRRAEACAFQAWAAPLVDADPRAPWTRRARRALTAEEAWSDARAAALAAEYPLLAPWLADHAAALARLRFGVRLRGEGTEARLDAIERDGTHVRLVRFLVPGEEQLGPILPDRRWSELWAADLLRRRHAATCTRVDVIAWPLGGSPHLLTPDGIDAPPLAQRRRLVRQAVDGARERWAAGPPQPSPGFRCRDCAVADLCRAGTAAR